MRYGVPEKAKMSFYLTVIILSLYTVASAEGSPIPPVSLVIFTSTPTSIIPPFTKQLEMRCELGNFPILDDVKHVVSIGISRGDQRIASISDYHAAQADGDLDKITVEGDVTGTTGSFLLVEWSYPDMAQAGDYQCVFTVLYKDGHSDQLSASLKVETDPITLQEIVKVLIRQQEVVEKLEDEITKQKEVDTKQEEVNSKVQDQLDEVDKEIAEVKGKVHELGHVETGTVAFGHSANWTTSPGSPNNIRYKDITVTFKAAYKIQPEVMISVTAIDAPFNRNDRRNCGVIGKNNRGFTIRCITRDNSFYYNLIVKWMSVASN